MNDPNAGVIATFFVEAELNPFKSEQEGRPIHEDKEKILILIVGDRNTEVVRVATDADRKRFSKEYARFKEGLLEDAQTVGTRLKDWPAMSPAIIKNFEFMNVKTVEHIAEMSDSAVQNFGMGGLEWREKARAYLAKAAGSAEAEKFAAENVRLHREIDDLKEQVRQLASQIETKRGPGRPPKSEAA